MLDGLYTALAGMEAQQRSTNAMAEDIANLDTPGYKTQRVSFYDLLYSNTGEGAGADVMVRPGTGQGTLQPTDRPLDVAITGDGYIKLRHNGTTALTRNGALQLEARGQLVTPNGDPLDPPIKLPAGTNPSEVRIATGGAVSVGGRRVGRITLVTVPAPTQLLAIGGGQFAVTQASGALRPGPRRHGPPRTTRGLDHRPHRARGLDPRLPFPKPRRAAARSGRSDRQPADQIAARAIRAHGFPGPSSIRYMPREPSRTVRRRWRTLNLT